MKNDYRGILIVCLFLFSAQACASIVTWNPDTYDQYEYSFNTATMTFPGFTTTGLSSITGAERLDVVDIPSAWYFSYTDTATINIELRIDNVWTSIFTDAVPNDETKTFLSESFTGATFQSGVVDGIRLSSDQTGQDQTFYGWATPAIVADYPTTFGSAVTFNFDATVPIPAAVWLFGSGIIGLIGVARRK